MLALVASPAMQLLAIGVGRVLARSLNLSPIEKGSVSYSNSVNLLFPLIIAMMPLMVALYTL